MLYVLLGARADERLKLATPPDKGTVASTWLPARKRTLPVDGPTPGATVATLAVSRSLSLTMKVETAAVSVVIVFAFPVGGPTPGATVATLAVSRSLSLTM